MQEELEAEDFYSINTKIETIIDTIEKNEDMYNQAINNIKNLKANGDQYEKNPKFFGHLFVLFQYKHIYSLFHLISHQLGLELV